VALPRLMMQLRAGHKEDVVRGSGAREGGGMERREGGRGEGGRDGMEGREGRGREGGRKGGRGEGERERGSK